MASDTGRPPPNFDAIAKAMKEGPPPSIDELLAVGLRTIGDIINSCKTTASSSTEPTRTCVQNLKDCMDMLSDLKKQESKLLDEATDSDLSTIAATKD